MAKTGPEVLLLRHGQTEWSLNGRHTGSTDIPLTEEGRAQARALRDRLAGRDFALVLTSPLGRARETADLAGLGAQAQVREDLLEWDYGEYEGMTTADIRKRDPDWLLWRDGCPGGETAAQVGARVDRVIAEVRAAGRRLRAVRARPRAARAGGALDRAGSRARAAASASRRPRSA